FRQNLMEVGSPTYSHSVRWRNNQRACRFFSGAIRGGASRCADGLIEDQLHPRFREWSSLAQAQYLEIKIFLSQYLLSSQGDRVAMAHSLEGRYPFVDCRLPEFCTRFPEHLKLRGLKEKYLLKKLGQRW